MFGPDITKDHLIEMLVEAWNECHALKGNPIHFQLHEGGWKYVVEVELIQDGKPSIVVHLCDTQRTAESVIQNSVPRGCRYVGPYTQVHHFNEGKTSFAGRLEGIESAGKRKA